eukprot:gene30887-biopygen16726
MATYAHLPSEVLTDVVLRSLLLESSIGDVSAVCRFGHSIVSNHLPEVLIHRRGGDMTDVLFRALEHDKLDLARELVLRPGSQEDSNEALLVVIESGGPADLAMLLLSAPQYAAHADFQQGQALVEAVREDCRDGEVLMMAAQEGHEEVVRMLLDAPQNAAHADCQDGRALQKAASKGHDAIVRMLLDSPQHAAHADCQDGRALQKAASNGHGVIVRMLLAAPQHAAHADSQDGQALLEAVREGHTEIVQILLEASQHAARANCQDGRALLLAAGYGHADVVRMLLEAPQHAAHADCLDGKPLVAASHRGHSEIVEVDGQSPWLQSMAAMTNFNYCRKHNSGSTLAPPCMLHVQIVEGSTSRGTNP